jgi:hypothetical protein
MLGLGLVRMGRFWVSSDGRTGYIHEYGKD